MKEQIITNENFVAGMIHDIRNPLTSMMCSLDYMRESEVVANSNDLSGMIKIALNCAEFITSHVGNFLDISKLKTSKIELNPMANNILELVMKIVEMHKFKAESKGLDLKLNASENLPELILLDSSRFT